MCFGNPAFDGLRYTVYNGPYLPSNINRQWYCASWRALCKLLNTPSIAIGGSLNGWFWLNPLYSLSGTMSNSSVFSIYNFVSPATIASFMPLSGIIEEFDNRVCDGAISRDRLPWSVCGLQIGDGYYISDNAAAVQGEVYSNAPLLKPLDMMRTFLGAS